MFDNIGFKKDETFYETWYGVVEGIYYTIRQVDVSNSECYELSTSFNSDGLMGSVLDFVENAKRNNENFINSYSIDSEHLSISFNKVENTLNIENFIKELNPELNKLNVKNTCVHCGSEENLYFYKHTKGISVMCEKCGENLKNEVIIAQNEKPHYVKGFFGSLLGALIGSIAWILLGKLGWVASFAGYLIAFCAFFGYKKMKGKLTKKGVIINIITIIVAFLLANYIGIFFELKEEIECDFFGYILITPALFTIKEFVLDVLKNLGLGAIFLFLGIRTTIKTSFKDAKNQEEFSIEKLEV